MNPQRFTLSLNLVHEPSDGDPLVHIIFVHGLQGHPYKTWLFVEPDFSRTGRFAKGLSKLFAKTYIQPPSNLKNDDHDPTAVSESRDERAPKNVFWPKDLLPHQCPQAKIWSWGYDTNVAKGIGQATNKDHLYNHGMNLAHEIRRLYSSDQKPMIFVAHSLGGLVIKETLAYASHQERNDPQVFWAARLTKSVIFFGTPHIGSKRLAKKGDALRKLASALGVDTNSCLLDSLALKNGDLERSHDAFMNIKREWNIEVKSFQEGLPWTGYNFSVLNEKVVPDELSHVQDNQDRRERLNADHFQMCKFSGEEDAKYIKVGLEVKGIYTRVVKAKLEQEPQISLRKLEAVRQFLTFSDMDKGQRNITAAIDNTCEWLIQNDTFKSWINNGSEQDERLLWIKGKPGSGKSTLVKKTLEYIPTSPGDLLVAYFCPWDENTVKKFTMHRSQIGLLRAIVCELLPSFPHLWDDGFDLMLRMRHISRENGSWGIYELEGILTRMFKAQRCFWTTIILDGMDEYGVHTAKQIVGFFQKLTMTAYEKESKLRVCFVSRTSLPIDRLMLHNPQILVDCNNQSDIILYVNSKIPLAIGNMPWDELKDVIIEKASGVFLWVAVAIDMLLDDWDNGIAWQTPNILINRLDNMPAKLEDLYIHIMKELGQSEDRKVSTQLFQWVLFSLRPLQIFELQEVLSLIDCTEGCGSTGNYGTADPSYDQFVKRVRRLSRGLIELNDALVQPDFSSIIPDGDSSSPGVGSFENRKIIQPIHESLREFFINRGGFRYLHEYTSNPAKSAHFTILMTSLDYCDQLQALDSQGTRSKAPSLLTSETNTADYKDLSWGLDCRLKIRGDHSVSYAPIGASASVYAPSSRSNSSSERINHRQVDQTRGSPKHGRRPTRSQPLYQTPDWHHDANDSFEVNIWPTNFKGEHERLTADNLSKLTSTTTSEASKSTPHWLRNYSIGRFIQDSLSAIDTPTDDQAKSYSHTNYSSVRGHNLEALPLLKPYIEEMFPFHAMAHQNREDRKDADTERLVDRLQHKTWSMWKRLRGDIHPSTTFAYFIAEWNLVSWARYIDDLDPNFCKPGGEFRFPIVVAAHKSNLEMIKFILDTLPTFKQGLRLEHLHAFRDKMKRTVLHHTASKNYWTLLDIFLKKIPLKERRIAVHIRDVWGQTPLHYAAYNNSLSCARALLKAGTSRWVIDHKKKTPLDLCSRHDDYSTSGSMRGLLGE